MLIPAPTNTLAPENISAINGFASEGEWPFYYEMLTRDGQCFLRLANRKAVEPDTVFEGTIVIDWQVGNRGREPGYHLDMPMTVSATPFSGQTLSFTADTVLSLDIGTVHDDFAPELSLSKIESTAGLGADWRDYIWVRYTGRAGIVRKTMPLANGEYVLSVPSNIKIFGLGMPSPDGSYRIPLDDPESPQEFSFTAGFPRDEYDGQQVSLDYALEGEYLDGQPLYVEASADFTDTTLRYEDYNFAYEGDKFAITSRCENDTSWQQLAEQKGGVVQNIKTTVHSLAYPDDQFDYTVLLDWQDITYNERKFHPLADDEYTVRSITGPSSITGADGLPRADQQEIKGELIGIDEDGNESSYGTIGINDTVSVSSADKRFKIIYRAVVDYAVFNDITTSIKYSVKNFDEAGTNDPALRPLIGQVRSVAGLLVSYGGDYIINEATRDEYVGSQGEEIADRDMERYGRYIQRGYAEFSYSNYRQASFTYLQKISAEPAAEPTSSTSGITQRFHLNYRVNVVKEGDEYAADPVLKSFSLFALLPKGWSAPSVAAAGWQDVPKVKSIVVSSNWNRTGRTLVRFDVDEANATLSPNDDIYTGYSYEFNMEFNAFLARMSLYNYGTDYLMDVYGVAHQFETDKYIEHKDGTIFTIDDKNDLDGDGDIAEEFAVGDLPIKITNTLGTHLEASEQVSSDYAGNVWMSSVETCLGGEYSYRLNFMTAATSATKVMFFDNIEQSNVWNGKFLGVDVSALEEAGYHPVVLGNINYGEYNRVSSTYGWEPIENFNESYQPRAVAIRLDGDTVPPSTVLSVIVKMRATDDERFIESRIRDNYTVSYTDANGAASTLTSTDVYVTPVAEPGTVVLEKIDKDTGLPISGARFELSGYYGDLRTNMSVGSYSLSAGTYYLYESTVPAGYVAPSRFTTFEVEPGKITRVVVENEKATANMTLVKTDATMGVPLEGVEFRVTNSSGYDKTFTTNALGEINLTKLPLAYYYFEEVEPLEGYKTLSNLTSFDMRTTYYATKYVKNERSTGVIRIIKKDETSGQAISGASFRLEDENGKYISSGTTNLYGQCSFSGIVWGVNYYLKETSAPTGYEELSEPIVVRLEKEELSTGATVEITNKRKTGSIQIKKTDTDTGDTLSGAHFRLIDASTNQIVYDDIVTDAFGLATVNGLEWGTYKLVETRAPLGHMISSEETSFSINASNVGTVQELDITNDPDKGTLTIAKVDGGYMYAHGDEENDWYYKGEKLLPGAEFELIDADGNVCRLFTTNASEPVSLENMNFGSYTLRETSAPDGYNSLDDIEIVFDRAHREFVVENQPNTSKLIGTKNIPNAEFDIYKYTDLGWWKSVDEFKDAYVEIPPISYNGYEYLKLKNTYPEITSDALPFFVGAADPGADADTAPYRNMSIEWVGTNYLLDWAKSWCVINVYDSGVLSNSTWTGTVQINSHQLPRNVILTNIPSSVTAENPYVLYGYMSANSTYVSFSSELDKLFAQQFDTLSNLYSYKIDDTRTDGKIHLAGFSGNFPQNTTVISSESANKNKTYDLVSSDTKEPIELDYGTYLLVERESTETGLISNWDGEHGIQGPLVRSYGQFFDESLIVPGYNGDTSNIETGSNMPAMVVPISVQDDTSYNGEVAIGALENKLRTFTFKVRKYENKLRPNGYYQKTVINNASGVWSVNTGVDAFNTSVRNTSETVTLPLTSTVLKNLSTLVTEEVPPDGLSLPILSERTRGFEIVLRKGTTDLFQYSSIPDPEMVNGAPYYIFDAISIRTINTSGTYSYTDIKKFSSNVYLSYDEVYRYISSSRIEENNFSKYIVDNYLTDDTYDFGYVNFVNDVEYNPYIYIIKHDDSPEKRPVAGAELTLFYQQSEEADPIVLATAHTSSSGAASFGLRYLKVNGTYLTSLQSGMLWVEETKVPDGYEKLPGQGGILFDWSQGKSTFECAGSVYPQYPRISTSCTYEIENHSTDVSSEETHASVRLTKHNKNTNEPVYGASFALYLRHAGSPFEQVGEILSTDHNGSISWEMNETYQVGDIVRVIEQPRPDVTDKKLIWDHEITEEEFTNEEIIFADDETGVIYNTLKQGRLVIHKKDKSDGKPLSGAVFDIYTAEAKELAAADVAVDAEGIASVSLPLGKYLIVEKTIPSGHHLDAEAIVPITGIPNGNWANAVAISSYEEETVVDIFNVKDISTLSIYKTDKETGEKLSGGVFEVMDENGNILFSGLETLSNGRTKPVAIPAGHYVVRETKAPERYVFDNTPIDIILGEGEDAEILVQDTPQVKLSINKVDKRTHAPLGGVEFDIISQSKEIVSHLLTNDEGMTEELFVNPGTYFLRETKTATGYQQLEEDIEIEIYKDTCFIVENAQTPRSAKIIKQDAKTKEGIAGVEMTLNRQDMVELPGDILSRNVSQSGSGGKSWSGDEQKMSVWLSGSTLRSVSLNIDVEIRGGIELSIPITLGERSSIRYNIYDSKKNRLNEYTLEHQNYGSSAASWNLVAKLPETDTRYTIEILGYGRNGYSTDIDVMVGNIAAKSTSSVMGPGYIPVASFTTDENGEYLIEDLDSFITNIPAITAHDETLYLFEIQAAPGYVFTDVCLGEIDLTSAASKEQVVVAENEKKKASLRIWKRYQGDNSVIPYVKFKIQCEDGTYIQNPSVTTTYNKDVFTTTSAGTIDVDNLEWGEKYYLYETWTSWKYELPREPFVIELRPEAAEQREEITIYNRDSGYYYTPVLKKELHGRALKDSEFTFEIATAPEGGYVYATGTNDADGNIIFPEISFGSFQGESKLYVREINKSDPTVQYDESVKEINLTYEMPADNQHIVNADIPDDTFINEVKDPPVEMPSSGAPGLMSLFLLGLGILMIALGALAANPRVLSQPPRR